MTDLTNLAAARLVTTLHLMADSLQQRLRRDDKGQAAAEYVGILVFVALLVLAIIALVPDLGNTVKNAITSVFNKITEKLG